MQSQYVRAILISSLFVGVGALAHPARVQCQWNTNGNNISNSNTGNVGVGTASPIEALHVAKGDANGTVAIFQKDTSSSAVAISTTNNKGSVSGTNSNATATGDLLLNPWGGNVGIGTTSPGASLDLSSATQLSNRLLFSGQEYYAAGNTSNSGIAIRLGVNRTNNRQLWIGDSASATNSTNGQLRMMVGGSNTYLDGLSTDGTVLTPLYIRGSTLLLNDAGGNVGIGTGSPSTKLHIEGGLLAGGVNLDGASLSYLPNPSGTGRLLIGWNRSAGNGEVNLIANRGAGGVGGFRFSDYTTSNVLTDIMTLNGNGNAGIGTVAPAYRLDVQGGVTSSTSGFISKNNPWGTSDSAFFPNGITTGGAANWIYGGTTFIGQAPSNGFGHQFNAANGASHAYLAIGGGNVGIGTTGPGFKLDVQGGQINASGGLCIAGTCKTNWSQLGGSQWADGTNSISYSSGNVGIGTTNATDRLTVYRGDNHAYLRVAAPLLYQSAIGFSDDTNGQDSVIYRPGSTRDLAFYTTTAGNAMYLTQGGTLGIATSSPGSQYKLDVNGSTNVTGNINVTGTINAKYQDVAEWVPSSERLAAGTVVVLDSTKSNQVTSSTTAYDTRVAGVISAQPGITLGEKSDNKVLVATTGRVRVMVDATKAPISIGDLLVTSDVPGVAMKSEAVNLGGVSIHRPGTIIGKALEPLAKGKGEILVLLSLQ